MLSLGSEFKKYRSFQKYKTEAEHLQSELNDLLKSDIRQTSYKATCTTWSSRYLASQVNQPRHPHKVMAFSSSSSSASTNASDSSAYIPSVSTATMSPNKDVSLGVSDTCECARVARCARASSV